MEIFKKINAVAFLAQLESEYKKVSRQAKDNVKKDPTQGEYEAGVLAGYEMAKNLAKRIIKSS